MDDMLANHVGVITGAAGGLGSATAQCFADHGASVVLIDLDADGVKAVADRITADGGTALPLVCDIVNEAAVARAAARTAERFARCDVLVPRPAPAQTAVAGRRSPRA